MRTVVHAVAGGAGEVVRAAAVEEDLLADLVGLDFLGVRHRHVHLDAARLRGDEGDERVHCHLLAAGAAERVLLRLLGVRCPAASPCRCTRRDSRSSTLSDVGEVARQLRVGALDDAGPEAEVALLERRVLRAALFLPDAPRRALPTARRGCRRPAPAGSARSPRPLVRSCASALAVARTSRCTGGAGRPFPGSIHDAPPLSRFWSSARAAARASGRRIPPRPAGG